MPHVGEKLHRRRRQRIVLGKLELCGKNAALKGSSFGALDEAFPVQQVVLGDGAGGDAFGRVVCEGAVFLEEAAVGGGLGHGGRMTRERMEKSGRGKREERMSFFWWFWDCLDVEESWRFWVTSGGIGAAA